MEIKFFNLTDEQRLIGFRDQRKSDPTQREKIAHNRKPQTFSLKDLGHRRARRRSNRFLKHLIERYNLNGY